MQKGKELIPQLIGEVGNNNTKNYSENSARIIVAQLLDVVQYLHSLSIVHKAILPENILLGDSGEIKLVGFNLSQLTKQDDEHGIFGGDPSFQAPELINQQGYGRPVDLWSVGIIAYILLCGYCPFKDSNTMRLYSKIRQGSFEFKDQEWKEVSAAAKELIKKLLCVDPAKRLSATEAKMHNWIKTTAKSALPNVLPNLKNYYN